MLEFLCFEKSGPVRRTVRVMDRTLPNILAVIEKLSRVRNFIDPEVNPIAPFVSPSNIFLEIDDVGLIWYEPLDAAYIHLTFWDGRLRGREKMCRSLVEFAQIFTKKIMVVRTQIEYRAVVAFIRRVGFEENYTDPSGLAYFVFPNYPR